VPRWVSLIQTVLKRALIGASVRIDKDRLFDPRSPLRFGVGRESDARTAIASAAGGAGICVGAGAMRERIRPRRSGASKHLPTAGRFRDVPRHAFATRPPKTHRGPRRASVEGFLMKVR
jgi:hypothetical protein